MTETIRLSLMILCLFLMFTGTYCLLSLTAEDDIKKIPKGKLCRFLVLTTLMNTVGYLGFQKLQWL